MLPSGVTKLGELIRLSRNRKGWSLDRLSEVSGVSATYISQIEIASPATLTGKVRRPSKEKIESIAKALELDRTIALQLAGWSAEDEPPPMPLLDTTQVLASVLRHYQDGSLPDEQQADLDSLSPFFRRLLRHIPPESENHELKAITETAPEQGDDETVNSNQPDYLLKE